MPGGAPPRSQELERPRCTKGEKTPAVVPGPTSAPPFPVTITAIHSAMRVFMFVYVILLWSLLFYLRFPTVLRAHPSRLFPLLRPLRSRVHNNGSILKRVWDVPKVLPWLLSIVVVFLQNPKWQNPSLPQLTASLCLTSFLRTTLHHQPQTPALSGVALHFYPCFAPPLTHLCVQSFHLPSKVMDIQAVFLFSYSGRSQAFHSYGLPYKQRAISQCFYSPSLLIQTQLLPTSPPSVSACRLPGSSTNHQPPRSNHPFVGGATEAQAGSLLHNVLQK